MEKVVLALEAHLLFFVVVFALQLKYNVFVYRLVLIPTLTAYNKNKIKPTSRSCLFFLTNTEICFRWQTSNQCKQYSAWHLLRSVPQPCTRYLWSHSDAHRNQGRNSTVRISNFRCEHFLLLTCMRVFSYALSWLPMWGNRTPLTCLQNVNVVFAHAFIIENCCPELLYITTSYHLRASAQKEQSLMCPVVFSIFVL